MSFRLDPAPTDKRVLVEVDVVDRTGHILPGETATVGREQVVFQQHFPKPLRASPLDAGDHLAVQDDVISPGVVRARVDLPSQGVLEQQVVLEEVVRAGPVAHGFGPRTPEDHVVADRVVAEMQVKLEFHPKRII